MWSALFSRLSYIFKCLTVVSTICAIAFPYILIYNGLNETNDWTHIYVLTTFIHGVLLWTLAVLCFTADFNGPYDIDFTNRVARSAYSCLYWFHIPTYIVFNIMIPNVVPDPKAKIGNLISTAILILIYASADNNLWRNIKKNGQWIPRFFEKLTAYLWDHSYTYECSLE